MIKNHAVRLNRHEDTGVAFDSVVRIHTGKKLLEKLRLPGKTAEVDDVTRIVEHVRAPRERRRARRAARQARRGGGGPTVGLEGYPSVGPNKQRKPNGASTATSASGSLFQKKTHTRNAPR